LPAKPGSTGKRSGNHTLLSGLSPTPAFELIESIRGQRYLMRTPMDLQGIASHDNGDAARGLPNAGGTLSHRTTIGAGLEFGNEYGDGRKWLASMSWKPMPARRRGGVFEPGMHGFRDGFRVRTRRDFGLPAPE
jgi:hypothetical protein